MPLLFLAILSLLLGIGGGLARLGWLSAASADGPTLALPAYAVTHHGAILVAGFLGTLIALERAVGSNRRWSYGAPLLTGVGSLLGIFSGAPGLAIPVLLVGAIVFVASQALHAREHPSAASITFALGAVCLAIGCALWLNLHGAVALWWIAFLTLAISAERLELSKILAPPKHARVLFAACIASLLASAALATGGIALGENVTGAALLALALWLARWDLARKSVKRPGLSRFIGVTLLSGYFWLALSGALLLATGLQPGNPRHDAALHSFFLGFVFSMIFAHAPIIFPTVLGLPIAFRTRFYAHFFVLHLGLIARVASDLLELYTLKRWSTLLNALAILLFLVQTVSVLGKTETFLPPNQQGKLNV